MPEKAGIFAKSLSEIVTLNKQKSAQTKRGREEKKMKLTGYLWALGLGMVGGAVAATVLPKQPAVKQAVTQAADSITTAVETAKDAIVE